MRKTVGGVPAQIAEVLAEDSAQRMVGEKLY
jgi:hypothetical protein